MNITDIWNIVWQDTPFPEGDRHYFISCHNGLRNELDKLASFETAENDNQNFIN